MNTAFTDPPRRSLKILVADDPWLNQTGMVQMLKHLGHQVDIVSSESEVLDILGHHLYDVVLIDLQMPHLDGLVIAQQICQTWTFETRPCIIAVTEQVSAVDQVAWATAGIQQWLVKPIRVEQLAQALHHCPSRGAAAIELDPGSDALSPLDAEVLSEIWHMAGDDAPSFLLTAIDTYLHEAHLMLQTIQEAIAQHQIDVIQRTAHSFKTMSSFWGANELSELCKTIEVMGKAAIAPSPTVMQQLTTEYERVEKALIIERQKACKSLNLGRSQA